MYRSHTEKPPLGAQINWNHPLAQGLRICHLFAEGGGQPMNRVNNRIATRTNGPTWAPHGMRFAHGSDQSLVVGNVPEAQITGSLTIVAYFRSFDEGTGQTIVSKDNNAGGRAYTLDFDTQADRQIRFYINGGGGGTSDPILNSGNAGFDLVNNRWYQVVATFKPGSFIRLYIDGKLWASGTANYSNIPAATANLRYGRRDYSGAEAPMEGEISYVYLYNRPFTSAEVKQLYVSPYSIFVPQRHRAMRVPPPDANVTPIRVLATSAVPAPTLAGDAAVPVQPATVAATTTILGPSVTIIPEDEKPPVGFLPAR